VDYVGQQLGNYRILRLLGTGGFAEVYLGEHVRLNTNAAIKVLHARLAHKQMEAFLNEARTIAHLDHPNIVRVMEFDVQAGVPFLVMTYAPNGALRQRHPLGQKLALATIIPYVKQVTDALQYAHESKLIHRDIKPENILMGQRNETLLSDFGIATIAQTSHSDTGQNMAGTAAYMAPEQIQGHPRYASDQYSLGIVVYEWLAGERPFNGSFIETCTQQLYVPPPPLRAKVPELPPEVEQVVLKALAKDSHQRFPSVQAFAEALEQASKSSQSLASTLVSYTADPATIQACSQCGNAIPLNATFCSNCGYYFAAAPPTFQTPRNTSQAAPLTTLAVQTLQPMQPYVFPAQKPSGNKNRLIVSAVLLVFLAIAGTAGYQYVSMLQHAGTQNLSCLPTTQNLLLGDCFQDNNNTNHWDLSSQPNQYSANISNGSLILEDDNNKLLPETIRAYPYTFTDFKLEVDADLSQGDPINGYGVMIRGALDNLGRFKTYYRFELFGNGQYAISKGISLPDGTNSDMTLVDFTPNSAIHPQGSINHISITAKGSYLTLAVNGVTVQSITDGSYNSGNIALFVANVTNAAPMAQVTFSKLGIYRA
jgi:serine/threonine protein kinase